MDALASFAIIFLIVVVFGFINEKTLRLTDEIALMLFTTIATLIVLVLRVAGVVQTEDFLYAKFDLNKLLVDGVLCFMLFAGSAGIKISKLKSDIKLITSLSLLTTLLGAVIFGALFFLVSKISGVGLSFPICLLFGAIVSPTDPIAATSILRKFNLPRRTGRVIEAESLFNDGVGVALFVCFSGIVKHAQSENFFLLLFQELGGGIAVGLAAGFLSFQLLPVA